jgi:hypothetical protein
LDAVKKLENIKSEAYNRKINKAKHEIRTSGDKKVVDKAYVLPQAMEEKVDAEVQRLLQKGYIRESKSTWLKNVRHVTKLDGSVRLTTNLIKLNQIVEQDSYTIL